MVRRIVLRAVVAVADQDVETVGTDEYEKTHAVCVVNTYRRDTASYDPLRGSDATCGKIQATSPARRRRERSTHWFGTSRNPRGYCISRTEPADRHSTARGIITECLGLEHLSLTKAQASSPLRFLSDEGLNVVDEGLRLKAAYSS